MQQALIEKVRYQWITLDYCSRIGFSGGSSWDLNRNLITFRYITLRKASRSQEVHNLEQY